MSKILRLLRNSELYANHGAALSALQTRLNATGENALKDGEPILARYTDTDNKERTLLGIKSNGGYEIFDNAGSNDALVNAINALDYTWDGDAKKPIVSISESNGVIAPTQGSINAEFVDIADTGSVITATTVEGALQEIAAEIDAMDLNEVGGTAGDVITTISENDGKVSATKSSLSDVKLTGYVKDTSKTGAIAATDSVEDALSKLENTIGKNSVSNADHSITVDNSGATTNVSVNIKNGEKVIKLDSNGIYTNLNLVKITDGLPATIKERYELRNSDNTKIGESIDIAKDSHIVSIIYITDSSDAHYQNLEYKYIDVSGVEQTTYVDMSSLILETEVENGIQAVNNKLSIKLDTTGDDTGNGKFLTVGANGLKLDGVSNAITAAVEALDVTTDAVVSGQYVAAIEETDGIVAVKARANVSEAELNNYTKGSNGDAVANTDTINGAISKLEVQVDNAKAAATTTVVEGTDAGNNLSITNATKADGHVEYTISLTDVASDAALTAEIAARKAVDGQSGDTYTANPSANYISSATSLNGADLALDAALKTADDAMLTGVAAGNGIDVSGKSAKSQTITAVAVADDPIIEVTSNGIGTKEDAVWDCGTY